jgi:hypothetical protein
LHKTHAQANVHAHEHARTRARERTCTCARILNVHLLRCPHVPHMSKAQLTCAYQQRRHERVCLLPQMRLCDFCRHVRGYPSLNVVGQQKGPGTTRRDNPGNGLVCTDLSGCGPIRKPCHLCTWPDNAQPPGRAIQPPCQENAACVFVGMRVCVCACAYARTHERTFERVSERYFTREDTRNLHASICAPSITHNTSLTHT